LDNPIKRGLINSIYKEFSQQSQYIDYSEDQNVSSDIVCIPCAATVIEGTETHTRTATIGVNLDKIQSCNIEPGASPKIQVPVTQAVIYGWYDNELGSYTNMLGDLTVSITDKMV
jgi:glyceraldehyde 3-phosphate dehydrogenase